MLRDQAWLHLFDLNFDCRLDSVAFDTDLGEDQGVTELEVLIRPRLTSPRQSATVVVHETIELECDVTAYPNAEIHWEHKGLPVGKTSRLRAHTDLIGGHSKLRIRDVNIGDQGTWICSANNTLGTGQLNFEVNVNVPPKIIRPQHTTYSLIAGEEIEVPCIASGIPEPKMIWVNIERNEIISKTNLLRIDQAIAQNTGAYICVAKNEAAEVYKQIEIVVHTPPVLKTVGTRVKEVTVGESITLRCSVEKGDPEPNVYWTKNDIRLDVTDSDGAIMFLDRHQTLRILVARTEHSGEYKCTAESIAGSDSSSFEVNVFQPPKIITSNREVSGIEGTSLSLVCAATGHPAPEIRWRKNGAKLDLTSALVRDEKLYIPALSG